MQAFFSSKSENVVYAGKSAGNGGAGSGEDPNWLWYIHSPCGRPRCRAINAVLEGGVLLSLFLHGIKVCKVRQRERESEGRGEGNC